MGYFGGSVDQRAPRFDRTVWLLVPIAYLLLAGVWIVASGAAVSALARSPEELEFLELLKGWGFVAVTGLSLGALLRRHELRRHAELLTRVDAENRYRTLVDGAPDAILIQQEDRLAFANPAAVRLFGVSSQEDLLGRSVFDFIDVSERASVEDRVRRALAERPVPVFVRRRLHPRPDTTIHADVGLARVFWNGQPALQLTMRDVTAGVALEAQARRLQRALRVAYEGTEALLRAQGEEALLETLCRTTVGAGGLALAWVGTVDGSSTIPRLRAFAGQDHGYLAALAEFMEQSVAGETPSMEAIRTGVPSVVEDVHEDGRFPRWRTLARTHGFAAVTAMPLLDGQNVLGVLSVASFEPRAFDQATLELLHHLAENVSFALKAERLRARASVAEVEARRLADELTALFLAIDTGVVQFDVQGVARRANRQSVKQLGFDPVGKTIGEVTARVGVPPAVARLIERAVIQGAEQPGDLEARFTDQNGDTGVRLISVSPILDSGGGRTGAVVAARDITMLVRQANELRALAARLQSAREDEASRIARDLHDDLGQTLTALKLELAALERQGEAPAHARQVLEMSERAVAAVELVDQALARVRHLASRLRPPALDRLGLAAALRVEIRDFSARTGLPCEESIDERITPGLETTLALYRIAQEALTNVARHARASRTWITLEQTGDAVQLVVEDDGVGSAATTLNGLGIVGMRERALAAGGQLSLGARPGGGLRVVAQFQRSEGSAR